MKTGGNLLFAALVILLLFSALTTYYQYFVLQNYVVSAELECDPETEACFVWICDPAIDGEEYCTGDLAEDTWYYKAIYRNVKNIPQCDPYDEDCAALECQPGEEQCEIFSCTDSNAAVEETGYACTDPATFEWPEYFAE